jgi:hypothetical protein
VNSPPTAHRTSRPCLRGWTMLLAGRSTDVAAGRSSAVYPLLGPHAAIDDTEINSSLIALAVLSACFRGDGEHFDERPARQG